MAKKTQSKEDAVKTIIREQVTTLWDRLPRGDILESSLEKMVKNILNA